MSIMLWKYYLMSLFLVLGYVRLSRSFRCYRLLLIFMFPIFMVIHCLKIIIFYIKAYCPKYEIRFIPEKRK